MKHVVFAAIFSASFAAMLAAPPVKGKLTETISWELKDSVLTVSGTGEMTSFTPTSLINNPFADENMAVGVNTIVIGEGITRVGDFSFGSRPDMRESFYFEGTPLYINVKRVVLPSTLRSIGALAFCRVPMGSIVLPEGLEEIGYAAFATSGLRFVTLPSTLKTISPESFSTCLKLVAVDFNNLALSIPYGAFFNCENLSMLLHSSNIRSIAQYCFNATPFEGFTTDELLKMMELDGLEKYVAHNMPIREMFSGDDSAYEARRAKTVDSFYKTEANNAATVFKLDTFHLLPYNRESSTCRIVSECHGELLVASNANDAAELADNWSAVCKEMLPTFHTANGKVALQSVALTLPSGKQLAAAPAR